VRCISQENTFFGPKVKFVFVVGPEKGITRASKDFERSIGGSSVKKNFPR
jgi:hypothetical protein